VLLYNSQLSGNCYKVRLLLAHLGVDYERREMDVIDRSGREKVLGERNPALRVPVLDVDDGRSLAESNAIIWYLGEGTEYVPQDPFDRAKALQWMFFEQYSHEPNIAVLRFWITILGRPERFADRIPGKTRAAIAALDGMERYLAAREFLVAERYSVADIALYAYTHVAHEAGLDLAGYPAIRAWLTRVADQPRHVPMEQ